MDKYIKEDIDSDLKTICQPMDFIGANVYQGPVVGIENDEFKIYPYKQGYPTTKMGWPVTEDAIYYGPKFLYERYQKPVYITENGLSLSDWKSLDGKVHDPNRIDFLSRYIGRLYDLASEGTDIAGYFQWSLLDNFEWAKGYKDRFGLVYVDYETLERTPKDSAYWYSEVIKTNFKNVKN
jgi:beta-glucosidase